VREGSLRKIVPSVRAILDRHDATPGLVVSIQTFGSYAANFHPHVHALVTDGAFNKEGECLQLPYFDARFVEEVFRRRVLERLHQASRLSEGFHRSLLGRVHSGFSVHGEQSVPTDDLKAGDRVALVAGGIGLAPLVLLARTLAARGFAADLYYGGRNETDVLKRADFERFLGPHRCRYATDDGSLGRRGLVTDLLAQALEGGTAYRRVFACGPLPMFRTLAALLEKTGVEGSFAMESEMACGFGVCLGCVAPTTDGRFATMCKEGPCVPPTFIDWKRI